MQRDSSNYLEYQPHLQYTKDTTAVTADSSGTPIASKAPVIPSELSVLKGRTSGDVLQNVQNAIDKVSAAIAEITNSLANDVAGGVPFADYMKKRGKAYEAAHQGSITGSPVMDVLPALLDVKDELAGIKDLMVNRFYQGKAPRSVDDAKKKEKDEANALIAMAAEGKTIPLNQVRMDNTLRDVISDRVNGATGFVDQAVTSLKTNLASDTGGRPTVAVQALVSTGSLLPQVESLNKLNFDKQREDLSNHQQRMGRITPVPMRTGVLQQMSSLQQQALQYKTVIDHFASQNIGADHPAYVIQNNAMAGLQKLRDQLKTISVDAYRLNRLQEMQGKTFLDAVNGKRLARQMHKLIGDVKRLYDPNSTTQGVQIQRIADLQTKQ